MRGGSVFQAFKQETETFAGFFLAEARRVARELVVVDAALRDDVAPEELQERVLNDGSRHRVFKRFFRASELAQELGGATVLHDGQWFVAVVT